MYWLYFFRFNFNSYAVDDDYLLLSKVIIILYLISEMVFRTWQENQGWKFVHHFWNLVKAYILFIFLILGYIFGTKAVFVSRWFMFYFFVVGITSLVGVNLVKYKILSAIRKKGKNYKRVLVIGQIPHNLDADTPWNILDPSWGYKIEDVIEIGMNSTNYLHEMEKFLIAKPYDEILITEPTKLGPNIQALIDFSEDLGLRVKIVPLFMENFGKRVELDYLNGTPVINVRNEPLQYLHNRLIKRFIDIIISSFFLITIYWWMHLLIASVIKLTSKGPVLFKQKRIGFDNKPFLCYKFRTMADNPGINKNRNGYANITEENDTRITAIGRILRITNLDELPQFLNVFMGDMSIVGPRPLMVQEDHEIQDVIKKYRVRRFVKPGITGWAQINGFRGGTHDMNLMQKRIEHDIFYIERWSSLLDFKIILKTAWQMVTLNTHAH